MTKFLVKEYTTQYFIVDNKGQQMQMKEVGNVRQLSNDKAAPVLVTNLDREGSEQLDATAAGLSKKFKFHIHDLPDV